MLCAPMLLGVIICDKLKKLLVDKSLEGVSVWRLGAGAGVVVISDVLEVVAPSYVSSLGVVVRFFGT